MSRDERKKKAEIVAQWRAYWNRAAKNARAFKAEIGLCGNLHCSEPADGCKLCSKHKIKARLSQKRRYERLVKSQKEGKNG
jgi:hypothetical protein